MTVAERLRPALRKQKAGKTEIEDVRAELRADSSGQEALFITLVLSDPPGDEATWPIDDLWGLRRITRETVARLERDLGGDIPVRWAVVFEPEHPDELDEADATYEIDVDG